MLLCFPNGSCHLPPMRVCDYTLKPSRTLQFIYCYIQLAIKTHIYLYFSRYCGRIMHSKIFRCLFNNAFTCKASSCFDVPGDFQLFYENKPQRKLKWTLWFWWLISMVTSVSKYKYLKLRFHSLIFSSVDCGDLRFVAFTYFFLIW